MNKIVREHYPVSQLPEELRNELHGVREVRVTIEVTEEAVAEAADAASGVSTRPFSRFRHLARDNFKSVEEVVAHVRALRDEWDEREQLHERLRNGS